jgi:serine/threonine protein kinase
MHRDLKPANILVDENWRGLIGDFGLSRSMIGAGLPTPDVGTPLYAAPEQMTPGVQYTGKVDVFAFGLIVYEIIREIPVFREPRSTQLPSVTIPDGFGRLMQKLIPRCWSLNPNDRPSFESIICDFDSCGFSILPGADGRAISEAVSEVLKAEMRHRGTRAS